MLAVLLGNLFLALTPVPAPAVSQSNPALAGIPVMITHGETIKKIGDLPEPMGGMMAKLAGTDKVEVGYLYNYFGVFWIDLWTWGGQYCLFHRNQAQVLQPEECAKFLGTTVDKLSKPWQYRFPLGLLMIGGIVLVAIPLNMWTSANERREKRRIEALFEDSRYKDALEIFNRALSHVPEPGESEIADSAEVQNKEHQHYQEAFDLAVGHLVQNGEDRSQAAANFGMMLAILAESAAGAETASANETNTPPEGVDPVTP